MNEAQVREALQEVAQTKENRLSKEEFIRFSECLRAQTPEMAGSGNAAAVGTATPDPPSSKRVADDGGITTKAAAKRRQVDAGAGGGTPDISSSKRVSDDSGVSTARWVFKPALALEQVSEKERSRTAELYAQVDETAAAKIEVEVAERVRDVASTLPPSLSAEMKEGVCKAWVESNYVKIVSQILNEAPCSVSTSWTFSPLVEIESLPEGARVEAARMYAVVNVSAASEIDAIVETEFSAVLAPISKTLPPAAQAELRTAWLLKHYTDLSLIHI